ncbi:hypothetical protein CHUAL_007430 [Chamberlinius hualienensis]
MSSLSEWFWSPSFWLPGNLTWVDLEDKDGIKHPHVDTIYQSFFIAVLLWIIKELVERYILIPTGVSFGLKIARKRKLVPNNILEPAFRASQRPDHKSIEGYAKKLQWSERQVERWFRQRRQESRPSTLKKFTESGCRFLYYACIWTYAIIYLWDKDWLWDTKHCWYGYPHQSVDEGARWLYMIQLGFYLIMTIGQLFNRHRKDFWQMLIHHIITYIIIFFSWTCNFVRIGTIIMVNLDIADVAIELAKMSGYMKKQLLGTILFSVFALTWLITRVGTFPYRMVYSTVYEFPLILPMFPAYYLFNTIMLSLLVLQIVWTYMILRFTYLVIVSGKLAEKDIRSETESDETISSS